MIVQAGLIVVVSGVFYVSKITNLILITVIVVWPATILLFCNQSYCSSLLFFWRWGTIISSGRMKKKITVGQITHVLDSVCCKMYLQYFNLPRGTCFISGTSVTSSSNCAKIRFCVLFWFFFKSGGVKHGSNSKLQVLNVSTCCLKNTLTRRDRCSTLQVWLKL